VSRPLLPALKLRPGVMVRFEGNDWQVWARGAESGCWWLVSHGVYRLARSRDMEPAHLTDRSAQ
jgi:hypothetical protein